HRRRGHGLRPRAGQPADSVELSRPPGGIGGKHMTRARFDRVRRRLAELDLDALLLSIGADLPWLTGYTAMPLPRLTMLVLPADVDATLVVPRLEEPRVQPHPDLFAVRPWDETEDAVGIVAGLIGGRHSLAVSDRMWA